MKSLRKKPRKNTVTVVAAWLLLSILIYISMQALSPVFDEPIGGSSVSRDTEYPYGKTAPCRPPFEYITYEGKTSRNGFPFLESVTSETVVIEECVERRTQETELYIYGRLLNILVSASAATLIIWAALRLRNTINSPHQ